MRLDPSFPHAPGETPESYVSRLARANGLPSGLELCKDMGIRYLGLLRGEIGAAERISELTGSPVGPLLREARFRDGSRFRVRGQALVAASFVRSSVRVCSACLADDAHAAQGIIPSHVAAFGRTTWTIAHLRTCPHHETVLVNVPGSPETTIQDFTSVIAPWWASQGGGGPEHRRRAVSGFEAYLLDRLDGRHAGIWLDELPFYAAARTCEMLGAVTVFGRKQFFSRLSEDECARAGDEGYQIAVDGPGSIFRALQGLVIGYAGDRATPVGPNAWFGRLYNWLEYKTSDRVYDPLRDLLAKCVADHTPFNPNERMFGKPVPYRKVHSLRSASNETGIASPRLRKALDHAGHLPSGHEILPDHEVVFDAYATSDLLRCLASALTLVDIAAYLDIDWRQVKQLVDAGHVKTMSPEAMGATSPYVDAEELNGLMEGLLAGAETVASTPEGACDLPRAVRRAHCRLSDMISLVRSGSLRWVGHLAGRTDLASILVNADEVCLRLRRPELTGHTRREVEQTLGIPTRTVNTLIEKGLIQVTVQRHPTVRRDILVIAPADLDRFRSRYMRMTDVAGMLGITLPAVPRVLQSRGIEPALTKNEVHATFYERAVIEALKKGFDDDLGRI